MRIMFTSYCNFIGELMGFGSAFLRGKGNERCLKTAIAEHKLCTTIPVIILKLDYRQSCHVFSSYPAFRLTWFGCA